jgi:hypothetical protein
MNRKTKTSGIWQFLELSGVLDTGSAEDIALKRKEYWSERKRLWKQDKRRNETEFKIYLDNTELKAVANASKTAKLSKTGYIKQAALAQASNSQIVPDTAILNHIQRLLELNYYALQEMLDEGLAIDTNNLTERLTALEREVLAFCNPQTANR